MKSASRARHERRAMSREWRSQTKEHSLRRDDNCILPTHTRRELRAHRCDELLDILAIFASVVCHSDNLSMWNEFADTVKLDLDPHGGKTPRLCFLGQGSVGVGP